MGEGQAARHQRVNNTDLGPGTLQAGNRHREAQLPPKVTQPCRESCPRGPHPPEGPLKALPATQWRMAGKMGGGAAGGSPEATDPAARADTFISLRLSTCHPSAALNSPPAREQGLPQIPGSRA